MTTVKITSPVPNFSGQVAGVHFVNGEASIETPRQQAALEYFGRHRYGISTDVAAPKGEDEALAVSKAGNPANTPKLVGAKTAKGKTAKADTTPEPPETATEQQAGIESDKPKPGAGEGPASPLHNLGRDGADPSNTGTPTTPVDATI